MFNKLQEAIALAEENELMEMAISDILSEENFDENIEEFMNKDINILIREEMELQLLEEDEMLDDMLEDEEEEEDVELEDLLESVFEGF